MLFNSMGLHQPVPIAFAKMKKMAIRIEPDIRKRPSTNQLLRAMKLIAFIMLAACLAVSAEGRSQITLSEKNAPLNKVFKQIQKQSGYDFLYAYDIIERAGNVTVQLKNVLLEEALKECLDGKPLKYVIVGKTVIIKEKDLFSSAIINDEKETVPPRKINGLVKDTDGKPLEGVSVIAKHSGQGTMTDAKGVFSIEADRGEILEFTMVGHTTVSVTVGNESFVEIKMELNVSTPDEIVVVGYGTQRKINLTGSVGVISSNQFENQPITNASQILAGKVAGVNLNQNSGLAGDETSRIIIRGVGTLNNADPLIIIDGVIVTNETTPLYDAGGGGITGKSINPLNSINPDDIESISVLKDAASSAIYGSRAANGVILITTKRGKRGNKPMVKYNGYYGFSRPTNLPQMVTNTMDFMTLMNEATANSGQTKSFPDSVIQKYAAYGDTTNTDWMKLLFPDKLTPITNHELSVSGGSNNTNYFLSFGMLNQDAVVQAGNFKRYNIRFNLDSKVFDNVTIGTSLALSRGVEDMPASDILLLSVLDGMRGTPVMPAYTSDGQLALIDNTSFLSLNQVQQENALRRSVGNQVKSVTQTFLGSVYADWEVIKGLHVRGTLTVNINPFDRNAWSSAAVGYNWRYKELLEQGYTLTQLSSNLASASLSVTHTESKRINPYIQATYDKTFGEHQLKVLLGASQETNYWSSTTTSRRGYSSNLTRIISAGDPATQFNSGNASQNALVSQFARVNYSFSDRYLLEANLRRDGSSRFGPNNKYGVFPSLSAGWVISHENFMQNVHGISLLKLRASWGKLGNQYASSDFPYLALIGFGNNYNFNGVSVGGANQRSFGNPDLRWETTTTSNIGLDIGLLNSKLDLVADYYIKSSDGIIFNTPLPSVSGFTSVTTNLASVQNKGWEFAANYTERLGNFRLSVGGNVAYNKNRIQHIDDSKQPANDRIVNGNYALLRGEAVDAIYGLKMKGIFQTDDEIANSPTQFPGTAPGDIKFEDISGPDGKPDGKIDAYDRIVLGQESPLWVYGFNVNTSYKQFSLNIQLQGIADAQTYGFFEYYAPTFQGSNFGKFWMDRWTPDNPSTTLPRVWNTQGPNTQLPNSFFVQDRSFLRLKNITLQYDLGKHFAKTFISGFKFYVSAQNLITFTKFEGFDPERSYQLGRSGIPQLKIYTAGLNVSF